MSYTRMAEELKVFPKVLKFLVLGKPIQFNFHSVQKGEDKTTLQIEDWEYGYIKSEYDSRNNKIILKWDNNKYENGLSSPFEIKKDKEKDIDIKAYRKIVDNGPWKTFENCPIREDDINKYLGGGFWQENESIILAVERKGKLYSLKLRGPSIEVMPELDGSNVYVIRTSKGDHVAATFYFSYPDMPGKGDIFFDNLLTQLLSYAPALLHLLLEKGYIDPNKEWYLYFEANDVNNKRKIPSSLLDAMFRGWYAYASKGENKLDKTIIFTPSPVDLYQMIPNLALANTLRAGLYYTANKILEDNKDKQYGDTKQG